LVLILIIKDDTNMHIGISKYIWGGCTIFGICLGLIPEAHANNRFMELRISPPLIAKANMYNAQQTISGKVCKSYLVEYQYPEQNNRVLGLDVKDSAGEIHTIHLAPLPFLQEKNMIMGKDDEIQLQGVSLTMGNRLVFLATQVTYQGRLLKLRNAQGVPVWSVCSTTGQAQLYFPDSYTLKQ